MDRSAGRAHFSAIRMSISGRSRDRTSGPLPATATEDRLSYMGFCYIFDSDAQATRIAEKICWFISVSLKQGSHYARFLPGLRYHRHGALLHLDRKSVV